ncbi:microtubule-binding protein [Bdellovibrio sp. HCB2-146]|uniref:microtubule-binding protein n=1 Tax=Bdellovibrio sp. HCB2-146 TaxID=3394362 RepID=UPI0039BD5005
MGFNYNKSKDSHSNDSFWTSYSDLFLGLSTIFLLLYVTASLRSGTDAIKGQVENQKLSMQVEELQHQLKMYESVKNEYMENQAPKDEVQEYQELMDKLTLLQEDTKNEKDRLVKEALENEKKVKALNKYQQMVRNVLNANKLAKTKINTRDDVIKEQDDEMEIQETKIAGLQQDIEQKKNLIAQGEQKIQMAESALQARAKELRQAFKANRMTKAAFEKKMAAARAESQARIDALNNHNAQYEAQLQTATSQLGQLQGALAQKENENNQLQGQIGGLQGELGRTKAEAAGQIAGLQGELGRAKAEAAGRIAGLKGEIEKAKAEYAGQLAGMKGELGKSKAEAAGRIANLQGQLAKAQAELEARKSVAGEIQKGFAAAGIKADIDMETGDVVLDFGQTYFNSDSDRLKPEMKGIIEKAMPIYSKSLFGNPKVSSKVSAVEIVGFASPTYQGRFIDPMSQKADDKKALKYNMDLSYRRANSIFSYLLDNKNNTQFAHQRELMAKMKVSGRSFLEVMNVKNRNIATAEEFCRQNDCKKAQRVIIRFSMDQKK